MTDKKSIWRPAGWAWELEILTLLLFLLALGAPYYLHYNAPPKATEELSLVQMAQMQNKNPVHIAMEEQRGLLWALLAAGLYIGHLVMVNLSLQFISTPFATLFTPSIFAGMAYCRTSATMETLGIESHLFDGSVPHALAAFFLTLAVALLLARLRMRVLLRRFKEVDWDISARNRVDGSMLGELLSSFRPLIYPPQYYRVCKEGILVIGYFYLLPIPFKIVHAVARAKKANLLTSSYTLATSSRHLVRIQLTEQPEPLFISPDEADAFVRYCEPLTHVGAARSAAGDTTSRGGGSTRPGVAPSVG